MIKNRWTDGGMLNICTCLNRFGIISHSADVCQSKRRLIHLPNQLSAHKSHKLRTRGLICWLNGKRNSQIRNSQWNSRWKSWKLNCIRANVIATVSAYFHGLSAHKHQVQDDENVSVTLHFSTRKSDMMRDETMRGDIKHHRHGQQQNKKKAKVRRHNN